MTTIWSILFFLFALFLSIRLCMIGGFSPATYQKQDELSAGIAAPLLPIRHQLVYQIGELLPPDEAVLLSGILLGEKQNLSSQLKAALTDTSTIHIAVVSGQNLTLLVGFCMGAVSLFGRRKTIVIALFMATFYALLTGFQVPVIRSLLMVFFSLCATFIGREGDSAVVIVITAALMLIYQPNWLFSVSFQLSFLATIGVVVLAPLLKSQWGAVPELLREEVAVSVAAQLLTAPVIAINFHQISLIGIAANLLILWTIGPIMLFGGAALLISLMVPLLGGVLVFTPQLLLRYVVYAVELCDRLPFAVMTVPSVSIVLLVGYYCLLFSIYLYLKSRLTVAVVQEVGMLNCKNDL